MWDAEYKLHLYPAQQDYRSVHNSLEELLTTLEFIASRISTQRSAQNLIQHSIQNFAHNIRRYEVGDKFLSHLTFMGCSPNIELEPQENKPYCYIEIEQIEKPRFISGKNLKPAKCPHCKFSITKLICANSCACRCENCHKTIDQEKLNWRKTAFYASSWITIGNIYELEAIPNDSLLNALENKTGIKWKVAYIRRLIQDTQEVAKGDT